MRRVTAHAEDGTLTGADAAPTPDDAMGPFALTEVAALPRAAGFTPSAGGALRGAAPPAPRPLRPTTS